MVKAIVMYKTGQTETVYADDFKTLFSQLDCGNILIIHSWEIRGRKQE